MKGLLFLYLRLRILDKVRTLTRNWLNIVFLKDSCRDIFCFKDMHVYCIMSLFLNRLCILLHFRCPNILQLQIDAKFTNIIFAHC